jgi:hypothetical protein
MCSCVDVEIGSYDNQILLDYPKCMKEYKNNKIKNKLSNKASIDICLVGEIKFLWENNIKTTGCCCGHNKKLPYIGVFEEDVDKMIDMGYIKRTNLSNGIKGVFERKDSFYPKTIEIKPEWLKIV